MTSFIYRNKFYFLTSFIYTYIFNENICNKFYITMTFIYRKTSLYLQRFINCMTSFIVLTRLIYYVTQVLYILQQVLILHYNLNTKTKKFYS